MVLCHFRTLHGYGPERSKEILCYHWTRLLVDREWSRFFRRLPLGDAATVNRVAISLSTSAVGRVLLSA
jgi:hypothetical protein